MKLKDINESFSPEEMDVATATSRTVGAVGPRAVVPRAVRQFAKKKHSILDFGAGRYAAHAQMLSDEGYKVTAYDFGSNVTELHDPNALHKQYDIVYASNVLNVQSSVDMLERTVAQIANSVKSGGIFIGNLPGAPRKSPDVNADVLSEVLSKYFSNVERISGTKTVPVLKAIK